jgi:hypothetical protein
MNSWCHLFGKLLIPCLACLVLFQSGCGSSSKSSNDSLELLQSNVTVNASSGGSISMSFWTLGCGVIVSSSGTTFQDPASEPSCFSASGDTIKSWSSGNGFSQTPVGFVIGLATDPVPPKGTSAINGILVEQDSSGNYWVFDYTGTASASSQTLSGSFTCDATQSTTVNGEPACGTQTFNFTGNVTPTS